MSNETQTIEQEEKDEEKRPIGVERSKDCVPYFSIEELGWQ